MISKPANVVPLREESGQAVERGRVLSVSGMDAEVALSGFTATARIAFSCLVRPEPEDLVLCVRERDGSYCLLGIAERPGAQDMTLSFPAGAELVAERGELNLYSGRSSTVASADRLNFVSDRAVHKSREAVVDFESVAAQGQDLKLSYKNVLLIGHMISTMARNLVERAVTYIRHTEDSDQVKAGQIMRKTGGMYSMDSERTIMVSKRETKIDGERIFMA